ncbi:MAG: heat-inducible transcription repressor HrcA [Clostridiales bacterium]|nr:heat-inducible transcription repressor HrcA [Clostridiales bacterium]
MITLNIDDRKLTILQMIIDDYINTAEPIGSRSISKKYNFELSAATIRNEMAELEEMGYLHQPHTSAGRIPSDKAYRFYVDKLMNVNALSVDEASKLKTIYDNKSSELESLLTKAARTISDITNYTSIAVTPRLDNIILKSVRLIPVDSNLALLIIVTDNGTVKDLLINVPENVTAEALDNISRILVKSFSNKRLSEIDNAAIEILQREMIKNKEFFHRLVDAITDTISGEEGRTVITEGVNNILNFPEYKDVIKAQEFFSILKRKDILFKIADNSTSGVNVYIGDENEFSEMKSYSIITATYNIHDRVCGAIGIIGPTRMEYNKMIAVMDNVGRAISKKLESTLLGDNKQGDNK